MLRSDRDRLSQYLAPTDEAFAELGDAVTELQANPEAIAASPSESPCSRVLQALKKVQEALDVKRRNR